MTTGIMKPRHSSTKKMARKLSDRMKAVNHVFRRIALSTEAGRKAYLGIEKRKTPLFEAVEIETTTVCNRKCSYCPNANLTRPAKNMDEALFRSIIDSLHEIDFSGRVSPHFYGEPLVDKRILKFLAYTREKLPKAQIKLFTNGDLLTYGLFLKLIDAGVDVVRIAQHDPEPRKALVETLKKIKENGLMRHIEYVKYYDNEKDLTNRGGLVDVKSSVKKTFCDYVTCATVDYDGNVLLCCQDYLSKHRFGSLRKEKLVDVWNSPRYKALRDKIKCGIWPLEICKVCAGVRKASSETKPAGNTASE